MYTSQLCGTSSFGTTGSPSWGVLLGTCSSLESTSTGNIGGDEIVTVVGRSIGDGLVYTEPEV